MLFGIDQIKEILPHRSPFLLVDQMLELTPGQRGIGRKCVSYNEPFFAGHFPTEAVMPGVLIIEALAQVGAVVCLSQESEAGKIAYFGGINTAKFKNKVVPGDVLTLEVELVKSKGNVGIAKAKAYDETRLFVEAELTFVIGQAKETESVRS